MEFVIGAAIVSAIGGAIALWYRYSNWGLLRRARRVPVAQIKDGAVAKIVGRLRNIEPPLDAPLTHRPCAYYRVLVEQRVSRGKSSHWKTVIDERHCVAQFLLEDDTGRALVRPDGATFLLDLDREQNSGVLSDASPELEAYLASHGEQSQGWVFNKRLRYREGILEEGETVAVMGLAHLEPDPDPAASSGFRERPMRPWLAGGDGVKLLISDKPSVR